MRTFALIAALACFGLTTQAQQNATTTAVPAKTAQDPHKEAVRTLSGQLKDALSMVQQLSLANNKEMQAGNAADSQRFGALRVELAGVMNSLDKSLTEVNSATPETFEQARTEALANIASAEAVKLKMKEGR